MRYHTGTAAGSTRQHATLANGAEAAVCAAPGLDMARLTTLARTTRTVAAGAEVFAEGDEAGYCYQVLSGTVRLTKLAVDGRRQICGFALEGEFFGLSGSELHHVAAEAVTDVKVACYPVGQLRTLAARDPLFGRDLLELLLAHVTRMRQHVVLLGRKTASERLASFLVEMSERTNAAADVIVLPMGRGDVADYLGLTPETVSRCFAELKRVGVIALVASHRIEVRDADALQDAAGD